MAEAATKIRPASPALVLALQGAYHQMAEVCPKEFMAQPEAQQLSQPERRPALQSR